MNRAAALAFLFAVQLVGAPPPRLVREIRLDQIIPGRPEFASVALTFSPDDNWIAMVGGYHLDLGSRAASPFGPSGTSTIFLVPRNGPMDQRIQIDSGLYSGLSSAGAVWSPDSGSFFVQGLTGNVRNLNVEQIAKLWNLRGEELWRRGMGTVRELPVQMFFLDPEHLLAGRILSKKPAAGLATIDLQGQVVDTWAPPKQWTVVDISAERRLLAVATGDPATQTLVVDYPSKKVILTKDNPFRGPSRANGQTVQYFTEGGKTLCSSSLAGDPEPRFGLATECWDVDSGKSVAKFVGFSGAPATARSRGSRLILTRYSRVPGDGTHEILGAEYVVWDFRSGTEVAAWKPRQPNIVGSPLRCGIAISSTGRYAAEIVGDVLRIYELP